MNRELTQPLNTPLLSKKINLPGAPENQIFPAQIMLSTGNTNFRELYFKYKDLTRILGKPTFTPLHAMLLELKTNTSSVPCNLGVRAHSYAGCILSPVTYVTIAPLTSFIIPLDPGLLNAAVGATQLKISLAERFHEEACRTFQNYQLVQRLLIQQVLEEIDMQ